MWVVRDTCFWPEDTRIAVTKRVRRNEEIEATEVRVIRSDGEQAGVMGIAAAIDMAADEGWVVVDMKRDWKRVFAFEPANGTNEP